MFKLIGLFRGREKGRDNSRGFFGLEQRAELSIRDITFKKEVYISRSGI